MRFQLTTQLCSQFSNFEIFAPRLMSRSHLYKPAILDSGLTVEDFLLADPDPPRNRLQKVLNDRKRALDNESEKPAGLAVSFGAWLEQQTKEVKGRKPGT